MRTNVWVPGHGEVLSCGRRCYAAAMKYHGLAFAVVWVMSMAAASTTYAQPPTDDATDDAPAAGGGDDSNDAANQPDQQQVSALLDDEARTRFQLGSTLYRQGRVDDAAREFRAAYEVSHRAELLYNLYLVERDAGNTREAAEALRTYLRDAEQVPDRGLMEGRLAALDRQMAAADAAHTTNDHGDESDANGDDNTLDENGEAQQTQEVRPIHEPPPEPPSRALPIALIAGGGGVLAAGAIFAVLAKSKHDSLSSSCTSGVCLEPGSQSDIDAMGTDALLADIAFAVGGVSVATGLILYFVQGSSNDDDERTEVNAGCDGHGCGVNVAGRF